MNTLLSLSDLFLTGMISYGASAFGLALFISAIGAPLPASLLILAAGAFSRQGVLDGQMSFLLGLVGVVVGDVLGYAAGWLAKAWVERHFGNSATWIAARDRFMRNGDWTILVTRFFLTPLAIPVNLIAGGSDYSFWRFLVVDTLGELIWLLMYGIFGYIFWSQWELVNDFLGDLTGLALGIGVVGTAGYLLVKYRRRSNPATQLSQNAVAE